MSNGRLGSPRGVFSSGLFRLTDGAVLRSLIVPLGRGRNCLAELQIELVERCQRGRKRLDTGQISCPLTRRVVVLRLRQ